LYFGDLAIARSGGWSERCAKELVKPWLGRISFQISWRRATGDLACLIFYEFFTVGLGDQQRTRFVQAQMVSPFSTNQGMQMVSPSFSGEHHPAKSAAAIHQAPPDAAGRLINLALSSARFVIAPDETAWAVIDQAGHREVHQLGSDGFKQWLLQRQFKEM
jgi:hypothetical protein